MKRIAQRVEGGTMWKTTTTMSPVAAEAGRHTAVG